ncbi:MAG: hypothetical protein M1816_000136 [Peltula sp. TS41687]|nr:MAG: hypothetical protein M1816_000136 [Peltula sp. TS41687]
MAHIIVSLLVGIGAVSVLLTVFSYIRLIFSLFLLHGISLRKYGSKGSWAIVSGASDGIGKEFALQLAQKGFNIVLISRTESRLQQVAQEIKVKSARPDVQTKIVTMDFAKNDDDDYAKLKSVIDGLDVAVLINNVGKSHEMPVSFIETSRQEMTDIIMINCLGTLRLTQIVAPKMVARKRGLILTMGSFGGLVASPLLATYSGSKAFLQHWSTALGSELKPHGVDVELVLSYLVTSAMSKIRRPSMFIPNPRNFVKAVLGKIGRSGGAQGIAFTSTPYWSHGIMHWALKTFLGTMNRMVADGIGRMHESIRRRALRKMERDGKKLT